MKMIFIMKLKMIINIINRFINEKNIINDIMNKIILVKDEMNEDNIYYKIKDYYKYDLYHVCQ